MILYGTNQRGGGRSWSHVIILKFLALQWSLNNLFCRGHFVVPGHKCWREYKNIVYISWRQLDPQVGVIQGKLNSKVALRLVFTFSKFVTNFVCWYSYSPWLSLSETHPDRHMNIFVFWANLVSVKAFFLNNFFALQKVYINLFLKIKVAWKLNLVRYQAT